MIDALVDDVVTVTDEQIVDAMRLLFERLKVVAEPSGASALAALLGGGAARAPAAASASCCRARTSTRRASRRSWAGPLSATPPAARTATPARAAARRRGAATAAGARRCCMPGTNSASTAPTASTTAATGSAATTPSLKACGEAYEPLALNTDASTATPITPPSSRIAFVAPEAWPASCGRTLESTALADGAKTSAMPVPARMNGTTSAE